ncbi:hypothetical protein [Thalassobacillus devorans]|uniref:hypothetical protein n=1 Tax=Thalassobacillus devorans TaxID=279813 RepID=UPI0004905195|nr:hypothetical protein [Thalassobacillus devorans]
MRGKAFIGLWRKEWVLMKVYYFVILIVGLVFAVGVSGSIQEAHMFMITGVVLVLHMFILSALLMYSLNREVNQLQLFLHSPQSAAVLIGVKFLQSLLFMVVSMTIFGFITVLTAKQWVVLTYGELILAVVVANMFIIGQSLLLAVLLLFLWVIHQILRTYLGGLSIVISIILFVAITGITSMIRSTAFYEQLVGWGKMKIKMESVSGDLLSVFGVTVHGDMPGGIPVVLGELLAWGLAIAVLYTLSIVLMDRKVEV